MKKVLLALGFTVIATSAQAVTVGNLKLNQYGNTMFNGTNNILKATSGMFGQLVTTKNTTLKFTFLGKEAGNTNSLLLNGLLAANSATNKVAIKDTFTLNANAGIVNFGFTGNGGVTASNMMKPELNIAFIENTDSIKDAENNPFAFLVGFNDGGVNDADFDDYVVGINEISAVPAPAALSLMASALGMFVIARRRNKANTNQPA